MREEVPVGVHPHNGAQYHGESRVGTGRRFKVIDTRTNEVVEVTPFGFFTFITSSRQKFDVDIYLILGASDP